MGAFLKDVFPKISSAALKARLKWGTHLRRMMMGKLASYIFASLLFAHAAGLADEAVRIIEQTENSIRIEISAPIPIIRDTTVTGKSYSAVQVTGWPHAAQDQQAGLPFKSVLLHLASKEATVEILSAEDNRLTMRPPPKLKSFAINDKRLTSLDENFPSCVNASHPQNNDECHFVFMQWSYSVPVGKKGRCWLTNFRQFPDRGSSGDMLGQTTVCGLSLT